MGLSNSLRDGAPILAESRGLEFVARRVTIELEALRFGRMLQRIEMRIEIGDSLFGIEIHGDFNIGRRGIGSCFAARAAMRKPRRLRR